MVTGSVIERVKRAFRRRSPAWPVLAAAVVIVLAGVLILPVVPELGVLPAPLRKWFKIVAGGIAALLLLIKEVLSAFARDDSQSQRKKAMEDWAAISGLFGVVFGVPAVYAQLIGS